MTLSRHAATYDSDLTEGVLEQDLSLQVVWDYIETQMSNLAATATPDLLRARENSITQLVATELQASIGARPFFFQKEFEEPNLQGAGTTQEQVDLAVLVNASGRSPKKGPSHAANLKEGSIAS
jgi:hypothetical protein